MPKSSATKTVSTPEMSPSTGSPSTRSPSTRSTTEKPYHHGDLRQSLIDAACKHLVDSGADTLSLRALAREIGVSQTAPYRHFESKSALFRAIALHGFEILFEETNAVSEQYKEDVEQSIVEIGMAYVDFARRHPEKYQLLFDSALVDFNQCDDLVEAGSRAFGVLIDVIERGIANDVFVDRPALEVAGALWASIHGTASLLLSKAPSMETTELNSPAVLVMRQLSEDPRPTIELFLNSILKPC